MIFPLCLPISAASARGQSQPNAAQGSSSILQRRYDEAQRLQSANNLAAAAQQYRIFLADALGELALGYAHATLYDKAAGDFDEALRLVPAFPTLRLQYARAALSAGNVQHASSEAQQVLSSARADTKTLASAHEVLGRVDLKLDKNAEAKAEFEKAVALDPTFGNGYELAVADLALGDGKGAGTLFAEMLKSYGDTAPLHLYFGQAYAGSDFQAEAVAEFQHALAEDPHLAGAHYGLAAAYLASSESRVADAEAELRKEIQLSPANALAYTALGHLLAGHSSDPAVLAEAEGDLKRASVLDPLNPDAFLFLGQLYASCDRSEDAQAALRRSIELTTDPSRNSYQVFKAHFLLGRMLLKTGKIAQGEAELAISRQYMGNNLHKDRDRLTDFLQQPDASSGNSASTAAAGNLQPDSATSDDSKRVVALEAQLSPAIADSYNNLGAIFATQSNFRAATLEFKRAAEWNPKLPGLDYNWGRAAFAAGEFPDAVLPLSRYLREHPEDDGGRAVLGLSEAASGQFARARDTLAPLNDKPATPSQVRLAYAKSLIETGDTGAGIRHLEALEKLDPTMQAVHSALGQAYASQGSKEAERELQTAVQLDPADATAYAQLAKLELQKGQRQDAIVHLQAAVKLQPANAAYQQALAQALRQGSK